MATGEGGLPHVVDPADHVAIYTYRVPLNSVQIANVELGAGGRGWCVCGVKKQALLSGHLGPKIANRYFMAVLLRYHHVCECVTYCLFVIAGCKNCFLLNIIFTFQLSGQECATFLAAR